MNEYAIKEILDLQTGKIVSSDELLGGSETREDLKLRLELYGLKLDSDAPRFVCLFCGQKIMLRGSVGYSEKGKKVFHFAHFRDSEDCPIKTGSGLTTEEWDRIRFNGVKESDPHKMLKSVLEELLNKTPDTSNIEVEKRLKGYVNPKKWKKPDVSAIFKEHRIVFEIQLSTTWLKVIFERQRFYRENQTFILWIFEEFDTNDDARKLAFSDVFYSNHENAYVLDAEAITFSREKEYLFLKCFYREYFIEDEQIQSRWIETFVSLSDLTFDYQRMRLFYRDTEAQRALVEQELQQIKIERETQRQRVLAELKVIRQESEELREKAIELANLQNAARNMNLDLDAFFGNIFAYLDLNERLSPHGKFMMNFVSQDLKNNYYEAHFAFVEYQKDKKDYKNIKDKLVNIQNLKTISIDGITYSIVSPTTEQIKKFLEINLHSLKALSVENEKNNPLFLADFLEDIPSLDKLNRIIHNHSHHILFDFSNIINEYKMKILPHEAEYSRLENAKKSIGEEIKKLLIGIMKETLSHAEERKEEIFRKIQEKIKMLEDRKITET